MKSRFKRLRPLVQSDVQQMNKTIIAACVLHNICIISADDLSFDADVNEREIGHVVNNGVNDIFAVQERARGNLKRLNIARRLRNRF